MQGKCREFDSPQVHHSLEGSMQRICGDWSSTELNDMLGNLFVVGDKVVKAVSSGHAVNIEIDEVTDIVNDKLYLNNSKVPVRFPGRLLIVTSLFKQ